MTGRQAFWLDERFDRERATLGTGLYAERLWANLGEFDGAWGDIAPVTFCCAAWRVATPPFMEPGYVRWHRRILEASCVRNTWDGSMTAQVTLVSPPPASLTGSREWWRDRGWQGWPEVFGQFVEPAEQDLAKAPHLRATLRVDAPVPLDRLPAAPEGPGDLDGPARPGEFAETAHRALVVMVAELNELLMPIIAQLEDARS
ncbi:hypothetical protein GCM10023085_81710 [Actinomadura viridis]|uniref:Uncharacterized protein n=1 Tax=Actinomadura viridis TaxID=58110 RepID=A0A931DK32_9ACTN|nr:hypothetical protein [Actinomadura viridis]MBG6088118.1 hypothetical protein [Actinomadura viridis]